MVIGIKAAKALGLSLPQSVVMRADELPAYYPILWHITDFSGAA